MFVIIRFSLGFPKRVKGVSSILVVREETHAHTIPMEKIFM